MFTVVAEVMYYLFYCTDDVIIDCRILLVISILVTFAQELRGYSQPFQVMAHYLQV